MSASLILDRLPFNYPRVRASLRRRRGMGQTSTIQQEIIAAANDYGVPPSLALAVAQQESSFNPNATNVNVSKSGVTTTDYGLFQINSQNLAALNLTPTSVMDPTTNIDAGVAMLSNLLTQYNGNATLALEAYNAGPSAVASGNIPSQTQSYVASVLANETNYSDVVPASYTSTDTGDDTGDDSGTDLSASTVTVAGITATPTTLAIAGVLGLFLLWKMFGD